MSFTRLEMALMVYVLAVLLVLFNGAKADENEFYQMFDDAFDKVEDQSDITDQTNLTSWNMMAVGTDFSCSHFEIPGPAQTVHELTPYDIQVVGALGDSVTAAMGAKACTLLTDLIEYRGVSWSIGGDKDLSSVTTLPNIIKQYNPNVKGYSIKTGGASSSKAKLNVAVSGGIAQDMPSQARKLVDKMKADSSIDFDNDWKLVTLWIGGNNLCRYCQNSDKHSPENYAGSIKEALDILHNELPRTFVNLVQIIDVTRLDPLKSLVCDIVHLVTCPCTSDSKTSEASTAYQEALNELVNSGRYYTKDDFTVVIQPFFLGVDIPRDGKDKPDKSYFAPDCFHFSTKGHKEGAVALWNNMIEPVGDKNTGWQLGGPLNCPTATTPYFYTYKNSNLGLLNSHTGTDDDSGQHSSNHSFVAIAIGTTVGVAVFILAVIVAVVIVGYKIQHRKNSPNSENIPLVVAKI